MEDNLAEALEVLFGKSKKAVVEKEETLKLEDEVSEKSTTELIEEAQTYYGLIEDSMKKGDWAGIGDSFDKLGNVLDILRKR